MLDYGIIISKTRLITDDTNVDSHPQKYMMILITGLCRGGLCLSRSDVVTFTCLFKPAEIPGTDDVDKDKGMHRGNIRVVC